MIQKSFFEQLGILIKILSNNKNLYLILGVSIALLTILLIFNNLKNKKIPKIVGIVVYSLIVISLLLVYHNEIFTLFDYLINNIFILLFFPNVAVYMLVLIVVNIIMIKSILNKSNQKILKTFNCVMFIIFNLIFYLMIDTIINDKIDIYNGLNVYTDTNLMVLIQISMYLFIFWLIILLIDKISKTLLLPKPVADNVIISSPANIYEPTIIKKASRKIISDIPEMPNTLVVSNEIKNNIKGNDKLSNSNLITNTSSFYTEFIDIVPVKKKKTITQIEKPVQTDITLLSNMDKIFGKPNTLSNIMQDVTKLKEDKTDINQIRKIYKEITLNGNDLTLNDYNYLIKTLKEIKNNY